MRVLNIIAKTAGEMYNFQQSTETHSEYTTEYDYFTNSLFEELDFEEMFPDFYVDRRTTMRLSILPNGEVSIYIFVLYWLKKEGNKNASVEGIEDNVNNILHHIGDYITQHTNLSYTIIDKNIDDFKL